jgi:hypothetical protein
MILYRFYSAKESILPILIICLSINNFLWFTYYQIRSLKHNNYSEQKINMNYLIQASEYDTNMHLRIQCKNMHEFL